jgi:AcrR family transcriptional regulator
MSERVPAPRRQRPRGSVTREAVVFGALAVLDRVGAEALTIRAVARQVGAPPMSLYTHFASKEALLELMVREIVRHLGQDDGHSTWQAALEALCRRIYTALHDHPHWAPLLSRSMHQDDVPIRERLLALMVADGMQAKQAFSLLTSAVLSTTGLVVAEHTLRAPNGDSAIEQRFETLRRWSEGVTTSPVTREALLARTDLFMRDVFDVTLRSLVRGFESLAREARIES